MLALSITNIKHFMSQLLTGDAFYSFLLEEASITTYNTFLINGHLIQDFYTSEEWKSREHPEQSFSSWEKLQGICFDLIKGKHTPVQFRFTLQLKPECFPAVTEKESDFDVTSIQSLSLNIRYDGNKLLLTTATTYKSFQLDKTLDFMWDKYIKMYLSKCTIDYEELF